MGIEIPFWVVFAHGYRASWIETLFMAILVYLFMILTIVFWSLWNREKRKLKRGSFKDTSQNSIESYK